MRLAGGQTSKNDVCARIRECVGIYIYRGGEGKEGGAGAPGYIRLSVLRVGCARKMSSSIREG